MTGNDMQLLSALLGGFFVGVVMSAMTYMFFPKFIHEKLRRNNYCEPLQYIRVKAKYK
jgi:hypothetical protein